MAARRGAIALAQRPPRRVRQQNTLPPALSVPCLGFCPRARAHGRCAPRAKAKTLPENLERNPAQPRELRRPCAVTLRGAAPQAVQTPDPLGPATTGGAAAARARSKL